MIDTKINKILINVLTDGDINLPNTEKLLDIIIDEIYIKNQYDLVSVGTQELAKKLIDIIRNQPNIVRENFRILHLLFALSILLKLAPVETIKDQYYYLLAKFLNLDEFSKQYRLVARSTSFKGFSVGTAKYFFDDEFYHKMELKEQERSIYMYFYASTSYSGSSKEHMENMYPELYKVFLKAIELKQSDLVFYLYIPLLYSHNTLATTQEEFKLFNDEVETKLSQYIQSVMIPFHNLTPNDKVQKKDKNSKIKVAFIQERIFNYSINKVFSRLLKELQDNLSAQYEFIILDINFAELSSEPEEVEKIKEFGFKYVDLHKKFVGKQIPFYSTVSKAIATRQYIIDEGFDIIIGGNGRPEFNFLYTTRTVPFQLYWSHGNSMYDVENIDKRVSHFSNKNDKFEFDIFNLPVDIDKYNPKVDMSIVKNIKSSYLNNTFILGAIGRLIKIDNDEYLETVAEIMKQNPNTIYLACGSGDQSSIKNKIKDLGIEDRFYFTGQINAHIYGHVIDLLLSPFPNAGGEALYEYAFKERTFVIKHKHYNMNIKRCNEYDLLSKLKKENNEEIYYDLYSEEDINKISQKGYIVEENKAASMYACISSVENNNEYIDVSNLFINNKIIRDKVAREIVLMAKLDNAKNTNNFYKILNKE